MKSPAVASHPVLTLQSARAFEAALFGSDPALEWEAMNRAGRAVARAILRDGLEAGGLSAAVRILVLAGKGNNAGDALVAARSILEENPGSSCDVLFAFGPRVLRPLAIRAWRELSIGCAGRVQTVEPAGVAPTYDLCIGGIFGYQFRPPLTDAVRAVIAAAAASRIRFRAAVDLPSGIDEPGAFRADFTYATGSVKAPSLGSPNSGRLRYLDLGFFGNTAVAGFDTGGGDRIILPSVLDPLRGLRPASSDKRSQGHLAILGGSTRYPGSVLMATQAALRSGVGLVTAMVPRSLVAAFAAQAPEAMWVGLPETGDGELSSAGLSAALAGAERATAIAVGPGLGKSAETHALVKGLVSASTVPLVIDADGLQPDLVRAGSAPRILTPHAGELLRIAEGHGLLDLAKAIAAVVVAKGPVTRVTAGDCVYHCLRGGPVLSRGGSGDLLAGLAGGLLAQTPTDPLGSACRAVFWHATASDALARAHGQTAVHTAQVLDFLAPALRESESCPPR